ncbi:MAG: hypothetical protein ACK5II_02020 [Paracoccus sp. (in: a-proteobacteria)]
MQSVQWPDDRQTLQRWLKDNGGLGTSEPTKAWKEWWTLNQALRFCLALQFLGSEFVAMHQDKTGHSADFRMHHTDKPDLLLEVTEATTREDRREIALSRTRADVQFLGACGGRFKAGVESDAYERAFAADGAAAISRKSRNRYGGRAGLLVYPNSNAVFAETRRLTDYLQPLPQKSALDFVLIVRSSCLIAVTRETPTYESLTQKSP